jgi:cell division protein FtsZ
MSLNITIPNNINDTQPKISVIGIGGAGGNAVNTMINANVENIEFIVANTDGQALSRSQTKRQIQLGKNLTLGLGAGSDADTGRKAAEESIEEIMSELGDVNMLFITTGMGGGTGSGAAPVIAKAAKEKGILTVAVVTKPFDFEGKKRMDVAEIGLSHLKENVDTLIVIPNQNLFKIANEKTTFAEAFKMADDVLYQGVCGITDLITNPGLINLDFADIKTIMGNMGKAMMGSGESSGEDRAKNAAQAALNNPLLDDSNIKGAHSILLNIQGGPDMALFEVDEAASKIRNEVDENANIIFGSSIDDNLEGIIRVSVVATGLNKYMEGNINDLESYQKDRAILNSKDNISFINEGEDIDINDELNTKEESKIKFNIENDKLDQFDIESQINELDILNDFSLNTFKNKDFVDDKNSNQVKKGPESFDSSMSSEYSKSIVNRESNNLFKKVSSFFISEKLEEKNSTEDVAIKNNLTEISKKTESGGVDNEIEEILDKKSNYDDLFNKEEKKETSEHQIDLINIEQETDEIDEKVLEIPAFLRRQAN